MASRTASLARAARHERLRPDGDRAIQQDQSSRPELDVVDQRALVERSRRRQARVLLTLAVLCVAGPLVLAALGRAVMTTDQVRSDALQSQIAQALQVQQDLQLQKAELLAPARVLSIAETSLHMVTPSQVTYLRPVDPGQSVAEAHRPATRGQSPPQQGGTADRHTSSGAAHSAP